MSDSQKLSWQALLVVVVFSTLGCPHKERGERGPLVTGTGHAVLVGIDDPTGTPETCWAPTETDLYISQQEHANWQPNGNITHFKIHFYDQAPVTTGECRPKWGTPFGPDNAKVFDFEFTTTSGVDSRVPKRTGCYKYQIRYHKKDDLYPPCNDPNVVVK